MTGLDLLDWIVRHWQLAGICAGMIAYIGWRERALFKRSAR